MNTESRVSNIRGLNQRLQIVNKLMKAIKISWLSKTWMSTESNFEEKVIDIHYFSNPLHRKCSE